MPVVFGGFRNTEVEKSSNKVSSTKFATTKVISASPGDNSSQKKTPEKLTQTKTSRR